MNSRPNETTINYPNRAYEDAHHEVLNNPCRFLDNPKLLRPAADSWGQPLGFALPSSQNRGGHDMLTKRRTIFHFSRLFS
jgi:hypothetical protein